MPDNEQDLKSLAQRVSLLEARVTGLESRFASPEEPTGKIKPKQTEVNPPAISIKLLSKTFHRADYNAGDSGDRMERRDRVQSVYEGAQQIAYRQ